MPNPLHVLIVEDDELLRSGLELIIDSEEDMRTIGTAANGLVALQAVESLNPDIMLLDLKMPEMGGIACVKEIRRRGFTLPILILTTFNEEDYIFEALAAGANGYLLKSLDFRKLVQTIRDAMNHQYVLPVEVAAQVAQYAVNNSDFRKTKKRARFFESTTVFTAKERQIIAMLLDRYTTKEIAEKLYLSQGTIKNNLSIIYSKLGVQSRLDAIARLEAWIDNQGDN
ncbi:response regulator transcription factor [Paenibacillus sp. IB182496]|uniref:Response regulator transcription factor n=1 Tax=Paenibacillus sabuli TaxID=2772509 RepID=A0A927GUR1_9BACL|nr:response regulator transcription factor [Paenibacillus sabuli]MBD2848430.1 response regulator transcription factor [Paenibacillus sabuli]